MWTLLVAALLVSLVVNVYSQKVADPSIAKQVQCITDAITEQNLDILHDCGDFADFTPNVDLINVDLTINVRW